MTGGVLLACMFLALVNCPLRTGLEKNSLARRERVRRFIESRIVEKSVRGNNKTKLVERGWLEIGALQAVPMLPATDK